MAEMPIPQDFNRFIPPQSDGDDVVENVPEIQMFDDVEEQDDGSAIVRMDTRTPAESPEFYENMAETYDSIELDKIALKYVELIEKDKDARLERDKQYEDGIRRTGLGNDAPGGASFMGASKVVHPVMAEGCVDFAARAIKELFPPDGPARTKITGEATEEKLERAEAKRDFTNWQLTEQIEEYRDEQEQLLTQLPLGGSQYFKVWWDEGQQRICVEFLPIDNVYLPFASANFYTSHRVTEVNDITEDTFSERIESGLYRDITYYRTSQEPEQTQPEKANDKVEGKNQQYENIDGVRRVYHIYTWMTLEDDGISKGKRAPYILMVDDQTTEVVGLYRNWEDGDKKMVKLDWIVEWKFIPWRGAYAIGLPHLIGGLSAALTGALRALLDSAHINNTAAMLKLKGGKVSGQSVVIEPTQVTEIEGAPGVDDIRKIAMPMPFNPPSQTLFSLLGFLTTAAKGVVTTAEEKIADITSNAPVGTTQALIEQGAAVFSSIHARLHASQARVFKIIARLNRWYLDDSDCEMAQELRVTAKDFERNTDIIPVSDPHIFAESQRYAQIQTLAARAQANPDLYNRLAVEKRILKQIKLPEINEVLPDPAEVKQMNPALENVAMALGKPCGAFPGQDHLAHLQVLLDFAKDPLYGSNPTIAPTYMPRALEHAKQHITLFYLQFMSQGGVDTLREAQITTQQQQALAMLSPQFFQQSQQTFSGAAPVIGQMIGLMQQLAKQQQQQDPAVTALLQSQMAETQRKAQYDQGRLSLDDKKVMVDNETKRMAIASTEQIKAAEITNDVSTMTIEKQWEMQQAEQQHQHQIEQQAQEAQQAQAAQMAAQQPAVQPAQPPVPPQGASDGQ